MGLVNLEEPRFLRLRHIVDIKAQGRRSLKTVKKFDQTIKWAKILEIT